MYVPCMYVCILHCQVIPNIWSVNMDPDVFPEPEKYILERFLNEDEKAYGSDRCFHSHLVRISF